MSGTKLTRFQLLQGLGWAVICEVGRSFEMERRITSTRLAPLAPREPAHPGQVTHLLESRPIRVPLPNDARARGMGAFAGRRQAGVRAQGWRPMI
jgi:hypothetical protein